LLVALASVAAVSDVETLQESAGETVGLFGSSGSASLATFDWTAGEEELGESAGTTAHLSNMITVGGYLESTAGDMQLIHGNKGTAGAGDDICWDSIETAKTHFSAGTTKTDLENKMNAITRMICKDGFDSTNRPSCCPSDPNSTTAVPTCDATLCFLKQQSNGNGKDELFGKNSNIGPITVGTATKWIQGDVTIELKKASVCLKTGISDKPLECHSEKKCEISSLDIEKVCEESSYSSCTGNAWKGTGTNGQNVDISTTAWTDAKKEKAKVLTGYMCNAK